MTMPESQSGRLRTGTATILLVEDEPALRRLFTRVLAGAGYRIFEAGNGEQAMRIFADDGERIDLLLTDMRMPRMGGAELARQLRVRSPGLKLLCISGYPGADAVDPAIDFLAKPFSVATLLSRVREILVRV